MSAESEIGTGKAWHRGLLDERSTALARRGRSEVKAATRPILLCLCGSDRYGLPLGDVAQVMASRACTAVPGSPDAVLGLVSLSGRVVSVIDLAEAMGQPGRGPGRAGEPPAGHFVVLRGGSAAFALAVGRVDGIVQIPLTSSAEAGALGEDGDGRRLGSGTVSVYAAAGTEGGAVVVVDSRRLLRRYLP